MTKLKRKEYMVCRALRLLADLPAIQLKDRPLSTVIPLIEKGHAEVVREYQDFANGKWWTCQEVRITDAGREALQKSTR